MDRLARRKPKALLCYTTDGDHIVVCKKGVTSYDLSESIRLPVSAGCMLTDMHDDCDNGNT